MIVDVTTFVSQLQTDFDEQIAAPEGLTVAWPNAPFEPPHALVPWARFSIEFGQRFRASLGSVARYRHPGVLVVALFMPLLNGEANGRALAALVERRYRAATIAGAQFLTPTVLQGTRDGARWLLPVQCPFYADSFG